MTGTKKILLTAGGTGGHVFPAQALGRYAVAEKGWDIHYVTDGRGRRLTGWQDEDKVTSLVSASFQKSPLRLLKFLIFFPMGVLQAFYIILTRWPDAVVGFGGYATFPILFWAWVFGIPLFLHEQNAVMGRVNRFFASKAQGRALTNPIEGEEGDVVGLPLRPEILKTPVPKLYNPPLHDGYFRILILGGSQGSQLLSQAIPGALGQLSQEQRQHFVIHHQVRAEDDEDIREAYHKIGMGPTLAPFFENVGELIAQSHLVICRAGAGTISEVLHFKKPAIYIPLGIAMDDHQRKNCLPLLQANQGFMLQEGKNLQERLAHILKDLYDKPQLLINVAEHIAITVKKTPEEKILDLLSKKGVNA